MTRLIAGGYSKTGARGLYPLTAGSGTLAVGEPVAAIVNVSAGVRVPDTRRWFLVDETAGRIGLYDGIGTWRQLASVSSGGGGPCHLALDYSAQLLAAANYETGTVAVFRLDRTSGLPLEPPAIHHDEGSGPVRDRQEGPHAHWVGFAPDGRLYVADLGIDRILVFAVDPETGMLGIPRIAHVAPPGSGPRQLAFHPMLPLAFLVSELASTLTVLRVGTDGTLTAERTLSTLPADAAPESLGGAIAINASGTRLHVSNRGHDSIASFAISEVGETVLIGHAPTGGQSPRFLLLTDHQLLVAHEQSGGVTAMPIDADGRPSFPVARADVPGAAFLGVLSA